MTGLLIAGAVLLFFVFLLTVPFHAVISADDELRVWIRVLFVKISVFPAKKRKHPKKRKAKTGKASGKKEEEKREERSGSQEKAEYSAYAPLDFADCGGDYEKTQTAFADSAACV